MSNTDYQYKYWVKCPDDNKRYYMTAQNLKDFIFKCGENEFSYSFVKYHEFREIVYRLTNLGYAFSHTRL